MGLEEDLKKISEADDEISIFLAGPELIDAVANMEEFSGRKVIVLDSIEKADEYTTSIIVREIRRVDIQNGNFYVLDTTNIAYPEQFVADMILHRFYYARGDHTSRVLVPREQFYSPQYDSFQNPLKLSNILEDLGGKFRFTSRLD